MPSLHQLDCSRGQQEAWSDKVWLSFFSIHRHFHVRCGRPPPPPPVGLSLAEATAVGGTAIGAVFCCVSCKNCSRYFTGSILPVPTRFLNTQDTKMPTNAQHRRQCVFLGLFAGVESCSPARRLCGFGATSCFCAACPLRTAFMFF